MMDTKSFDTNITPVLDNVSILLKELQDLSEIAYDEEEIVRVNNKLVSDLKERINTSLIEARQRIQQMKFEISDLTDEIQLLQQIFGNNTRSVAIPDTVTLKEKKIYLMKILEPLRKEKEQLISALNRFRNEERLLLEAFGREGTYLLNSDIPNFRDLDDLKLHVRNLNEEATLRRTEVGKLQCEIDNLMEELGIEPDVDMNIKNGKTDLTDKYLDELKEICSILKLRKEHRIEEKEKLMDKLSNLWNRISMHVNEREKFLGKYQGYKESTINAFKHEIERCEQLKKLHLSDYIQKLRIELTGLWDVCKVDDEEKSQFTAFTSHNCDDQVADELEELVEYYKKFYTENRKIFDLLEERLKLYDEYVTLENAASNPNRLFQNRGGMLLQEEKTRKRIKAVLPKFDKELKSLIADYELCHQTSFLYFGRPLKDVLDEMTLLKKKVTNKENVELTSSGMKIMKSFPKPAVTPSCAKSLGMCNKVPKSAPPKCMTSKNLL